MNVCLTARLRLGNRTLPVVGLTLIRVVKNFVGSLDFLEAIAKCLTGFAYVSVWMMLLHQTKICRADFLRRSTFHDL